MTTRPDHTAASFRSRLSQADANAVLVAASRTFGRPRRATSISQTRPDQTILHIPAGFLRKGSTSTAPDRRKKASLPSDGLGGGRVAQCWIPSVFQPARHTQPPLVACIVFEITVCTQAGFMFEALLFSASRARTH